MKYEAASACIPAAYVKQAAEYVEGKLPICTVIGFPNGYNTTAVKVFETKDAIANGASEIDMVINIGFLKDGRYEEVENEIRAIHEACDGRILKVIIETCLLTEEEKIKMMLNQAIAEGMLDGESTSSITKENLEKARNNDNSEFYENMQIENISGGQIQIKFSDTGDIFKLDNNGKIISSPEVTESSTTTDVDSEVVVYKYNFSNDVNFTDSATVEDFSSDNSLMLTDYDSDQVSSFLNAVVERISEVNEQQMGQLGLEASENPIVNIIPSIGLYLGNMNVLNQVNSNMSEAEINNFNQKFEAYESTNLKGVTVKGLLSTISLNNQSEETSNEVKEINYNGEEYEASEQNITLIKGEIDTEKSYRVEFEKDQDTGLIYRAVINEK